MSLTPARLREVLAYDAGTAEAASAAYKTAALEIFGEFARLE